MELEHLDAPGEASLLIVDDIPENLNVLGGILELDGYQVFAATSGPQALAIAAHTALDLALVDVNMPGMDGLELCRRLKAREATAEIPVIFVTAMTDTEDVVAGFQAGGADYISKPVRREEVRARVRTQLQSRRYLAAQREQAEHYRGIVNNMAEGLLILDPQGVIRFANPRVCHLLGFEENQLLGHGLGEFLEESQVQAYRDYLATHASLGPRNRQLSHGPREVRLRQQGGEFLALDLTVSPLFLRQPLYIGLLHDISRHKASERELMRIANVDPLTNLANRRHFDAVLRQEWQRALRNGLPLSLAMLDVDHFKLYNDSLGHQAGDRCLQQVAGAIHSLAQRPTDLAARYGGEEFVLVFAETDAGQALHLGQALAARVAGLRLPHPCSPTLDRVTVSVGVATIRPRREDSVEQLVEAADRALYRAKETGRNRVCPAD